MLVRHESLAGLGDEVGALAADGLRHENARPAVATAVGWNCTNSMWRTSAPARWAIAMPSPVAPGGLVVRE